MNHCVRNTTSRRSVFEKLGNSEIIFLIIISLKSGMENSIIQELNAEADRIILLFFFSVVICFVIFTNHASFPDKICSWNILSSCHESRGAPPPHPPPGLRPWTPPELRPGPPRLAPPILPPSAHPPPACQQQSKSLKPPISKSLSLATFPRFRLSMRNVLFSIEPRSTLY